MISQQILSLYRRPAEGIYKRRFNGSERFKELYELMADYHFALKAIEEELVKKGVAPISPIIFPLEHRQPLDRSGYSGCSKMAFFTFIKAVKLYHDALTSAEDQYEKIII